MLVGVSSEMASKGTSSPSALPRASDLIGQIVNVERLIVKTHEEFDNLQREIKSLSSHIEDVSEWISLLNLTLESGKKLFSEGSTSNALPVGKRLLMLKREREESCSLRKDCQSRLQQTKNLLETYAEEHSNLIAQEIALYESQFLDDFTKSCFISHIL